MNIYIDYKLNPQWNNYFSTIINFYMSIESITIIMTLVLYLTLPESYQSQSTIIMVKKSLTIGHRPWVAAVKAGHLRPPKGSLQQRGAKGVAAGIAPPCPEGDANFAAATSSILARGDASCDFNWAIWKIYGECVFYCFFLGIWMENMNGKWFLWECHEGHLEKADDRNSWLLSPIPSLFGFINMKNMSECTCQSWIIIFLAIFHP